MAKSPKSSPCFYWHVALENRMYPATQFKRITYVMELSASVPKSSHCQGACEGVRRGAGPEQIGWAGPTNDVETEPTRSEEGRDGKGGGRRFSMRRTQKQ